jgi:hypothetical protein
MALDIKLEHLCDVEGYVKPAIPIGPSSWGIRLIAPIDEGTIQGPKIKGKVREVGGDWALIRADHCLEIDVRSLIETDDGAFIYAYYHGVMAMTEAQVKAFLGGTLPEGLLAFVTPRFETSHEAYQWLNHIQAVGRGTLAPAGERVKVTYSWYVLTV